MTIKLILKIYILSTFIYFLVAKIKHWPLKSILILSALNSIVTDICISYKIPVYLSNNTYVILHAGLWFYIVKEYLGKKQALILGVIWGGLTLYYVSTINILDKFYNRYFALTSIIYIILFFVLCIKRLKNEDIDFFNSNTFILIAAPVIFLLGMSFMFGFDAKIFSEITIVDIGIYELINFIVNVIYYTLLNYYIYKSVKHV